MDAIVLRPQPGRATVKLLSNLLLAAPIAVSIALAWQMVLRHEQDPQVRPAPAVAARPQPAARPVAVALAQPRHIPTLPGGPDLFAPAPRKAILRASEEVAQVRRLRAITGVSFDESGLTARDGSRFELDGVALPDQEAQCRRLDGVTVSCRERIAARIEILARMHEIDCALTEHGVRVTGQCHAGKTDLAQDLLRNGLVRKADPGETRHAELGRAS